MYKVYMHITPNGKRYIGITKTKLSTRWQNGKGYKCNPFFNRAIEKYGWSNIQHLVLFEDLTKEEAEIKEIELISKYKTTNNQFGYNIDNGGHSIGTHSEATRQKLREAHLGKKQSLETRKKHKQATLKLWQNEDFRKKINNRCKNRYKTGKPVICLETQMIFPRIKDASEHYKICDETIRKCCHKKRFTAGGYHWEFYKGVAS